MSHHRGLTLWFLFGHNEALQPGQKTATSKRPMQNISQWLHIYLFDGLCFLACSVPLVYFGGNGRFMDVLCYCASLRQEPFFCWQAAWWQDATSLTVCQLCALHVVHQTLWLWQPDAYLWFVWGEINVYLDAEKRLNLDVPVSTLSWPLWPMQRTDLWVFSQHWHMCASI